MIKKILILAILGGLGYVGYLVWNNLSADERATVGKKVGEVAADAKDLAHRAADSLTDNAKDAIKKIDAPEKPPEPAKP